MIESRQDARVLECQLGMGIESNCKIIDLGGKVVKRSHRCKFHAEGINSECERWNRAVTLHPLAQLCQQR